MRLVWEEGWVHFISTAKVTAVGRSHDRLLEANRIKDAELLLARADGVSFLRRRLLLVGERRNHETRDKDDRSARRAIL